MSTGAARVVETASLDGWTQQWDDLVAAMPVPSPFLRSWWLRTAEDRPLFVLVVDGDRLLGGLALQRDRLLGIPVYRFHGSGTLCPDHLDVVGDGLAVRAALAAWAGRPGQRLFDLDGVAEGSAIPAWLPHAVVTGTEVAPWQPLPTSAGAYLASRPRSFRKTVRRARHRFDEAGATISRVDRSGLDAALDCFATMHRARRDRADLLAELPRVRRIVAAGVDAGEAWVEVMATPRSTLAVSIVFASCGRVSLYQTARSLDREHDNAGTLLNLATIERGAAHGCTEADLLRGEEPYKRHYAEQVRMLSRLQGAHGFAATIVLAVLHAYRTVAAAIRAQRPVDRSGLTRRRSAP